MKRKLRNYPPRLTELNARGLWYYLTLLCTLPLMLLASCSGDDEPAPLNPDGKRTVTITLSTANEMQTRAISDAELPTRCLMQTVQGSTPDEVTTMSGSNGSFTATVELETDATYTFLFWADDGSYTYTTGLTNLTPGSTVGVAYAATATWNGTDATVIASLKLVVSKVTLKTTTALSAGRTVSLTIPQTYPGYNVQTGAPTGTATSKTYTYTVPTGGVAAGSEVCSFYVLANDTQAQDLTLTCGGSVSIDDVTLVPGRHLTISGDIAGLAQETVDIDVDVSDDWSDDYRGFGSIDTYTDATQPSASLTGAGTPDDPYLITSAADFACFAGNTDYRARYTHTRLMTDIDIQTSAWTPIPSFEGTFDGNGHTISGTLNITVTDTEYYVGLFSEVYSATICDLNVTADATVEGTIGDFNCNAGGIIGSANSSTLSRCTYAGNLSVSVAANYRISAGGIAGSAFMITTTISYCTNTGTISTDGSTAGIKIYSGGIVGYSTTATLEDNAFTDGVPARETGRE